MATFRALSSLSSSSSSDSDGDDFVVVRHSNSDASSSSSLSASDSEEALIDAEEAIGAATAEMAESHINAHKSPSTKREDEELVNAEPVECTTVDIIDNEPLLKGSYSGMDSFPESSVIMVNGVDNDMYEVLLQVDVDTIDKLARFEDDAIYSSMCGALPNLPTVINRAKRLLDTSRTKYSGHQPNFDMYHFGGPPPEQDPAPEKKTPLFALGTPADVSEATQPENPVGESYVPSLNFSENVAVPESSVAVLKGAEDTDVAVLASLEILTIRQFCNQFNEVMEIVLPEERGHFRQLFERAQLVLDRAEHAYTPNKGVSVATTSDYTTGTPTQSNKVSSTAASSVKENQFHSVSKTMPTQSSAVSKPAECHCTGCSFFRTDALAALNRNREHLWVYHYVPETVYQQIKEDKALKSAYTLFNEYVDCPLAERPYHAWKRVHHAYLRDAARWMGRKVEINNVTDADVFAFLVWRASFSFAALDCTAGPKAIYFTWCPMLKSQRQDAIVVDQIVAEDTRDPFVADRFSRIIAIDLMRLHNNYAGKFYRAEFVEQDKIVDTNKWLPTTLADAEQQVHFSNSAKTWENFKSGEGYFSNVPHGCIVVGRGYIPSDCIMFEDDFPEDLKSELVIEQ